MFQIIKQKDVRNKVLFALFVVFLYRLGCMLPIPGVPFHDLADQASQSGFGALLGIFGGGFSASFFALGVMPFITSSILMQLAALFIPKVAHWKKEGAEGRKQIVKWTRFLTIGLGFLNAIGYDLMFQAQYGISYPASVPPLVSNAIVVFTLVVGVIIIMYLCEIVKRKCAINGMSLIVLCNVVSSVPQAFAQSVQTAGDGLSGIGLTLLMLAFIVIVLPIVVEVERAQRRIPVKSTKSGANSAYARSKETNYVPVPVDVAGLYAIIFSSSCLMMPVYLSSFFPDVQWLQQLGSAISSGWLNWVLTAILVIAFAFFMSGVNFNSEDIADNLKKQGSYIPGVRPGAATTRYLEYVVSHITLFGALFVAVVAVGSSIACFFTNNALLQSFGGTAIFICIGSSIQIMTAIEQQVRANDPESVLRRLGR